MPPKGTNQQGRFTVKTTYVEEDHFGTARVFYLCRKCEFHVWDDHKRMYDDHVPHHIERAQHTCHRCVDKKDAFSTDDPQELEEHLLKHHFKKVGRTCP